MDGGNADGLQEQSRPRAGHRLAKNRVFHQPAEVTHARSAPLPNGAPHAVIHAEPDAAGTPCRVLRTGPGAAPAVPHCLASKALSG
jgi:hypothetical protein